MHRAACLRSYGSESAHGPETPAILGRSPRMTFLNPLFLLGLVAAGIPLVIHLFNFRRPRRVRFSSLAFLHELQKSTMQRVRVKQWLLLALRTLAIAALVLSFARPTLEGGLAGLLGTGRASVAIVLDNSMSMTLRDAGGSYMEQARSVAAALMGDLDTDDEVFIVPAAGSAPGSGAGGGNLPLRPGSEALHAINAVSVSPATHSLAAAVEKAAALLAERDVPNRVIYVVSDLQASAFASPRITAGSESQMPPRDVPAVLVPVGGQEQPNLAVSSVEVLSRIVAPGEPLRIRATLTNYGASPQTGVLASAFLGEVRVAQQSVDVPPGGSAHVDMSLTPQDTGFLRGRVEIDDGLYEPDNIRPFSVLVPEVRRVLLVGSRKQYLELALSRELSGGGFRFDVDTIAEDQLAVTPLGPYNAVVLSGVTDISAAERDALGRYVRNGGGVVVFPGDAARTDDWNALLAVWDAGRIDAPVGAVDDVSAATFDRVFSEHVLFEGLFVSAQDGEEVHLEQPVIFRYVPYRPGSASEQTVISLSAGTPFLQEIRHGQGIVLFYAVEADVRWSDFPVRGLFLPLIYRSLYHVSSTGTVMGSSLVSGGRLQLRLGNVEGNDQVVLRGEMGEEQIPPQRMLPGAVLLDIDGSLVTPGIHDVVQSGRVLRQVVVEPDPAESDLAALEPAAARDRLEEITQPVSVLDLATGTAEALAEGVREARAGLELWNVFLGLALLFLLAEMVVASQWRPETTPS